MNRRGGPMSRGRGGYVRGGSPTVKRSMPSANKLYQIDFSDYSNSSSATDSDVNDIPNISTKNQNRKFLAVSSSESSDENIPVIITKPAQQNRQPTPTVVKKTVVTTEIKEKPSRAAIDLMSDYSYEDYSVGEIPVIDQKETEYAPPSIADKYPKQKRQKANNQQWAPQNQRKALERNRDNNEQKQHTIIQPHRNITQDDEYSDDSFEPNVTKNTGKAKTENHPYENEDLIQNETRNHSNVQNPAMIPENTQQHNFINTPNVTDMNDIQKLTQTPPVSAPGPGEFPSDKLPCYSIGWKKGFGKKNDIHMTFNDQVVYYSKETKTAIGKCHIICTDRQLDRYSSSYVGSIKKSQRLSRFTLYVPAGEQYGTKEAEMLGMAFYDETGIKDFKGRTFRFAIPKTTPYFPANKQMNLSRIALANVQSDDIKLYHSKLPEILPGNKHILQFGKVYIVRSVKNFIVEDEQGNVIFMIYKSSDGICSVRIAPPITPLIAFAISIAIITSPK
ncbi:hypothetical protein TRFO_22163 [Tritrichomonas foetus]|uniref:Tubby C-terminal domain-containing protein n=1 Tax=Tritrichomonas foetus TaxID=1144522 RepID=A0A1J4KE11_9EUKA|nr:hypothetical protein TRFO_22163 [Tritrichomonas foetus]|eukprot:OHT09144.1 hypothetical protein TRFO_22163 [Tritrichomonas foetus]